MSTDITNLEWLRQRLLSRINETSVGSKTESLQSLQTTEWSHDFERLMRNRLLIGRFRYGKLNRTSETNYDRVGSAITRLKRYQETGNLEYLVDVANLCLLEFEHSTHPDKHFEAIDDGTHAERVPE